MTRDAETLSDILNVVLLITAICATSFPVMYLFCPWWTTSLGRILMLHGFALALALDTTLILRYWRPSDILIGFWIEIAIFSLIAVANALMTTWLWRLNFSKGAKHAQRNTGPFDQ